MAGGGAVLGLDAPWRRPPKRRGRGPTEADECREWKAGQHTRSGWEGTTNDGMGRQESEYSARTFCPCTTYVAARMFTPPSDLSHLRAGTGCSLCASQCSAFWLHLRSAALPLRERKRRSRRWPLPGRPRRPRSRAGTRTRTGRYSLSFGYYNRNATEVLNVPVGPDNFVSPGPLDQGQPTYFYPRRHWGVFAVKVPADFGDKQKVVWTVKMRGKTFEIPGSLREEWQIDALEGEAGSNNTPPVLTFGPSGPRGARTGGHHGRAHGDGRQAAHDRRRCEGRRRERDRTRRCARDPDLVHAPGSGAGHVRAALVATDPKGWLSEHDGHLQQARRLYHSCTRDGLGHDRRRTLAVLLDERVRQSEGDPVRPYAATLVGAALVAVAVPLAIHRPLAATTHRAVTYAKDVAPILQQKCQECHQPGSIAPMSLLTYQDAVGARGRDQAEGLAAADAAVAHRQDRWRSAIQERSQPDRRADSDNRELGRRRDAARQSGRRAAGAQIPGSEPLAARRQARRASRI